MKDTSFAVTHNFIMILANLLGLGVLVLAIALLFPFLEPIIWAAIITLFTFPIYKKLKQRGNLSSNLASAAMCLLVLAFVIVPIGFLATSLTNETLRLYDGIKTSVQQDSTHLMDTLQQGSAIGDYLAKILNNYRHHQEKVNQILTDIAQKGSNLFLQQSTLIFKNLASMLFKGSIMLVTLFYLFRDGERLVITLKTLMPFPSKETDKFTSLISDMVIATLYGNLLTGMLQGAMGVLILWLLDFSAPILWGMVMAICTFIPVVGTALVWGPASIALLITGEWIKALILAGFGILIISQIDTFVKPLLISGRTSIHNLLLILGILGGISMFGFIGVILGPIIIALAISVLEFYKINYLERLTTQEY
ncbi:MAG: AI-2E family transporter [Dissulfuribacterales bacterium]